MAVMTEESADQGREVRWSANKKTDAVLRLLRGEKIDELSRKLRVEHTGWPRGGTSSWPLARSA